MSIPEACIEAATVRAELTKNGWSQDTDEARARRVILALAENMPEQSVGKALSAFYANGVETLSTREAIKAAIAAFLNHVGGTP